MVRWWHGGGRDVPAYTGIFLGPSGERTGPRLLPGSNQEHLGRGLGERSPGRGTLSGARDPGDDRTQVPGGLHLGRRGGKEMAEGKYQRVDGVRDYPCLGRPKAPAVFLRRTAKVPPAGVGFREEGDPSSRGIIWPSGGGSKGYLCASVVWRPAVGSAGARGHPPARQAGGTGPSRPFPDGPWELDGALCYHRTLSRGTQRPGGVSDGWPLGLSPGGLDGCEETRTDSGRGGSDGRTGGAPGLERTSPVRSDKYRGLAYSAAVNSQWDGAGGPGMERRPIPVVWPGSPGPSHLLWWMSGKNFNQSRPWL